MDVLCGPHYASPSDGRGSRESRPRFQLGKRIRGSSSGRLRTKSPAQRRNVDVGDHSGRDGATPVPGTRARASSITARASQTHEKRGHADDAGRSEGEKHPLEPRSMSNDAGARRRGRPNQNLIQEAELQQGEAEVTARGRGPRIPGDRDSAIAL